MTVEIICADARGALATMPAGSIHACVTSPPYWSLRDYGLEPVVWGDEGCEHEWGEEKPPTVGKHGDGSRPELQDSGLAVPAGWSSREVTAKPGTGAFCRRCSAWRGSLGLEPTPELYVEHIVQVMREVRRVLRDDGVLWLNLGDSYASGKGTCYNPGGGDGSLGKMRKEAGAHPLDRGNKSALTAIGLKPKDLVGVPWAVAKALQAPYYTGQVSRERDRVWLAAMIDGEGTICGFDHDRADGGGHRSGIHIQITNSSTALLDEAARIWPASRSEHGRPGPGHLGELPTFRWIVHGIENKLAVLRELYPYLVAKRQQAVVAYTMLLLMADSKKLGHSPQKDAAIAKRAVLTGLLSDLNHQRPVVLPDWLTEPPSLFEPGWYLRSDVIWSKCNPMPESVTDRPTRSHEYLFLLSKSARYYYDQEAVREPLLDSSIAWISQPTFEQQTGGPKDYRHGTNRHRSARQGLENLKEAHARGQGRNRRSVWEIATQPYPGAHFAVFPEKLVEPCILAGCPEGGTVLDPFVGSGTVGLVAERLGRHSVLIDASEDYCRMARERTAQMGLMV